MAAREDSIISDLGSPAGGAREATLDLRFLAAIAATVIVVQPFTIAILLI